MNLHIGPGAEAARRLSRDGERGADRTTDVIKLAILAVGGQGGGVVTSWIVALAQAHGFDVQATSVPGVAQRTGATIYYVEMLPRGDRAPILSLMPAAGNVDIVLAAELMEAGRAVARGFVTPDRTTLIASSHRAYAVSEKSVPGSGILDNTPILDAAEAASVRFLSADLEALAQVHGSVISASLFGALAGADVLPFPRAAFEETIKASGKGVTASLNAFAAGYDAVRAAAGAGAADHAPVAGLGEDLLPTPATIGGPRGKVEAYEAILARIEALPQAAQDMARRGLQKVVDYQDLRYGRLYLARVEKVAALQPGGDGSLVAAAAKAIANAMTYDDVIRVADLKTRSTRMARVRAEVGVGPDAVMTVTEYMHPQGAEICGLLPAPIGAFVARRRGLFGALDTLVNRGRRVRTDRLRGFMTLYLLAGLRPVRRLLLRHKIERAHLEAWLATVHRLGAHEPALAEEVLKCQRLIKGYSDTHTRGQSKFDKVLAALPLLEGRADAADWLRRLREAALRDENGTGLDGALKTVASLSAPGEQSASPASSQSAREGVG